MAGTFETLTIERGAATQPVTVKARPREFIGAFDPFPHPLPDGWNGLHMPWQRLNVVNAPFRKDDHTQGRASPLLLPKR